MAPGHVYRLELLFDRREDGYFHVHSPALPGLHLGGMDLKAICLDIPEVVRDLLWETKRIRADEVKWLPSIEDVQKQFPSERETYLVSAKDAA
ncbi:MAG TPA: hypothetical protein VJR47_08155 [Stellaceae bacterium]|nr:hypothetical protein [Stellaceae bacterium]